MIRIATIYVLLINDSIFAFYNHRSEDRKHCFERSEIQFCYILSAQFSSVYTVINIDVDVWTCWLIWVTVVYTWIGVQWLNSRVLDSRLGDCGLEPHCCHCVVSSNKTHYP